MYNYGIVDPNYQKMMEFVARQLCYEYTIAHNTAPHKAKGEIVQPHDKHLLSLVGTPHACNCVNHIMCLFRNKVTLYIHNSGREGGRDEGGREGRRREGGTREGREGGMKEGGRDKGGKRGRDKGGREGGTREGREGGSKEGGRDEGGKEGRKMGRVGTNLEMWTPEESVLIREVS